MKSHRRRDELKVTVQNALIVLVDADGTPAWEDADESRLVNRLFEFSVAREAIGALEDTTARILQLSGMQPQERSSDEAMARRNHWIIARSMPSLSARKALLERERQLKLWGRAA
jgi:hypothetical protein